MLFRNRRLMAGKGSEAQRLRSSNKSRYQRCMSPFGELVRLRREGCAGQWVAGGGVTYFEL